MTVESRGLRWAGHVARDAYRVLVGKSLGKHISKLQDNIKTDLTDVDC